MGFAEKSERSRVADNLGKSHSDTDTRAEWQHNQPLAVSLKVWCQTRENPVDVFES